MKAFTANLRVARVQRCFDKPLLLAAVLSIPTTILQFSSIGEPWHMLGDVLNWTIWLAFLGELVAMLVVVPDRVEYLFHRPLDLAIVMLTPPFFSSGVQSIRALRLFRLLRLEPLARRVFTLEGVKAAASIALLVAVAGGAGFAAEEGFRSATGCTGLSRR